MSQIFSTHTQDFIKAGLYCTYDVLNESAKTVIHFQTLNLLGMEVSHCVFLSIP